MRTELAPGDEGGDDMLADLGADLRAAMAGEPADDAGEPEPTAVEPEPDDLRADLAAEISSAGADDAAERAWQRELRRMADTALQRHGLDPAERHAAGISRREATRRLYAAEQMLREDPSRGLAVLASQYAGQLDPSARGAAAVQLLQTLGFDTPGRIAESERQRLAHFDAQARAHEAGVVQEMARLAPEVERFAAAHPDFQMLRGTMASLATTGGRGKNVSQLYAMARAAHGLPPEVEPERERAAREADQRREHAAKAARARTPNTAQSFVETPVDRTLREDLKHELRRAAARH